MATADLLSISCTWGLIPFRHYGIDMGDGTVIHLATLSKESACSESLLYPDRETVSSPKESVSTQKMMVQRVSWDVFSEGKPVRIERVQGCLPPDEVLMNAEGALGQTYYNLAFGNCEHFAREWKTGKRESYQSDRLIRGAVRVGLAGLAASANRTLRSMAFSGTPGVAASRAAGAASVVAELARHSAYAASRQAEIEHSKAEKIGRGAGVLSAALTGLLTRGPVGCVSATALYLTIDAMSHRAVANQYESVPDSPSQAHAEADQIARDSTEW